MSVVDPTFDEPRAPALPPPRGRIGERIALRVLQLGAIAVVLAASTLNVFELDRFFVPKELVLHATAFLAGLLLWRALRRMTTTRVDRWLAAYLLLGALSALLATNRWLAMRALAISVSSVLLFWAARTLGGSSPDVCRSLLEALALAVVLVPWAENT